MSTTTTVAAPTSKTNKTKAQLIQIANNKGIEVPKNLKKEEILKFLKEEDLSSKREKALPEYNFNGEY